MTSQDFLQLIGTSFFLLFAGASYLAVRNNGMRRYAAEVVYLSIMVMLGIAAVRMLDFFGLVNPSEAHTLNGIWPTAGFLVLVQLLYANGKVQVGDGRVDRRLPL